MNDDIYMYQGLTIPAKVNEGAISINKSESVKGDSLTPSRANAVETGNTVALIGVTADGYPLVEKADGTNGPIIGFVHDHPEPDNDPVTSYTEQQAIAADMLRKCGVETPFSEIRAVTAKTGEGIQAGNYVKFGADGQNFEKSATETNMLSLSNQGDDNRINIAIK